VETAYLPRDWTFDHGLQLGRGSAVGDLAWALWRDVGRVLRMLSDRAVFIGDSWISLIGIAWTLACYFRGGGGGPVLAFEDLTSTVASDSPFTVPQIVPETWGEKVWEGFSRACVFRLILPGLRWVLPPSVGGTKRQWDCGC